ncbi:hypothetical protein FRC07_012840 [Ceratobasidium sp. 392]|nr:hypothetical protein FRC07_012840 [Ceratobasidium sp. 392]
MYQSNQGRTVMGARHTTEGKTPNKLLATKTGPQAEVVDATTIQSEGQQDARQVASDESIHKGSDNGRVLHDQEE